MISDRSAPELLRITDSYLFTRAFNGSFTKSAARNFLARQAEGEYLLILDVDLELTPTLLEDCVSAALEHEAVAVVCAIGQAPTNSFWGKCRSLERQLLTGDFAIECPSLIDRSTFKSIGGFEEGPVDLLDDWVLSLKLSAAGIPFIRVQSALLSRETTNLVETFIRKYRRGQAIPTMLQRFPEASQVRFGRRFLQTYIRNWRLLFRSPVLTLGLTFLKSLDILAISLGRLDPVGENPKNGTRVYLQSETAKTYDKVRLGNNFNRYKHYAEIRSLVALLAQPRGQLLEVGCGTGRVTRELVGRGIWVRPVDFSPAMLREFTNKSALPPPVVADGMALPFEDKSFEGAYSMRVIWHLPTASQVQQMLKEMGRVASQFLLLDIANAGRWRHSLVRPLAAIYQRLNPNERNAHMTSRLLTLDDFSLMADRLGLRIEQVMPLDVFSPIWLRLFPARIARPLFPLIFGLESYLRRLIPPGRFLIRLAKNSNSH